MKLPRTYLRPLRYAVQLFFLLFTLYIGWQFVLFVRQFLVPGSPAVARPDSVDAFLPIGGLMAFKYFLLTGIVEPMHPAGFVLFTAVVGASLFVKKGFCGWICPVGTLSQYAWMLGEKVFGRTLRIVRFADIPLRSLKYILLGFFVLLIGVAMAPNMMLLFFITDYYKAVDVRMMRFFTDMSELTMWILIALGALSLLTKNFWCRYLCPYGALLGLVSRLSPFKVHRSEDRCLHCRACSDHCPALLDVEKSRVVKSEECFGCLSCVSRCPAEGALDLTVRTRRTTRTVKPWLFPLVLLLLFYLVIGAGMAADKWHSKIPREEYHRLVTDIQKEHANR